MAKLDSQYRITIPKRIMKMCNTDFNKELYIFYKDNMYILANQSPEYKKWKCFGTIHLDSQHRFYVPKIIVTLLKLNSGDNISFFAYDNKITFKKILL